MPNAVASLENTQRFELKSCPGGFVELRRMTYGQSVQRRAMMKMTVDAGSKSKDFKGELAMASLDISKFEFRACIVDHNLEDENGNKLNLSQELDFARLDPRVGQEIDKRISEMNNFEDDDEEN